MSCDHDFGNQIPPEGDDPQWAPAVTICICGTDEEVAEQQQRHPKWRVLSPAEGAAYWDWLLPRLGARL